MDTIVLRLTREQVEMVLIGIASHAGALEETDDPRYDPVVADYWLLHATIGTMVRQQRLVQTNEE